MPSQGDIVLIPVPFTDLSSKKRRPVIVVSNNTFNTTTSDIIVVAMTSNPALSPYSFGVTSADLDSGTLNKPGRIRVDNVYTLAQSIVAKTFGRVNAVTLGRIRQILADLCQP
jgi:mRNA interferase MazF